MHARANDKEGTDRSCIMNLKQQSSRVHREQPEPVMEIVAVASKVLWKNLLELVRRSSNRDHHLDILCILYCSGFLTALTMSATTRAPSLQHAPSSDTAGSRLGTLCLCDYAPTITASSYLHIAPPSLFPRCTMTFSLILEA